MAGNFGVVNREREGARTGRLVDLAELGRISGYSKSRLEQFRKEVDFPVEVEGGPGRPIKIDTAKFITWMVQRERAKYEAIFPDPEDDHKNRRAKADAEIAELKADEMRGDLVRVATVESALTLGITNARTRLLGLPTKLAPQVAAMRGPAKVRALLDKEIREALNELSRDDTARFVAAAQLAGVETAGTAEAE